MKEPDATRASSEGGRTKERRGGFFRSRLGVVAIAVAVALPVSIVSASAAVALRPSSSSPSVNLGSASLAASGSSTTTTTTTSGSTTTTTLPPAPAGFGSQLNSLYGEIYTAATAVPVPGQSTQLMSPSDFQQQVNGLSPSSLSSIYAATQSTPAFAQLPGAFAKADTASVKVAAAIKKANVLVKPSGTSNSPSSTTPAVVPRHKFASTVTPQNLSNFQPSNPVQLYVSANCPSGSPGINYGETSIFALQVAADVAAEIVAVIPDGLSTAFGNVTIPNVARIILAAIQLGVMITHDTFAYLQAVSNDCAANDLANLAANTDNTAYQNYNQVGGVAKTANEIDTNLAKLINTEQTQYQNMLTLDIQQALSAPSGTVPMAGMELPASDGGYLDATPVGVYEVVNNAIQAMQSSGQPMNVQATRDETLGEEAFAVGSYKQAFAYYRMAYQAAAG